MSLRMTTPQHTAAMSRNTDMNTAANIVKSETNSHYHKLPNQIARSDQLTDKAFRILVHILSFSSNWKIRKSYIANFLGCSERTVQRYISELRDKGYITYINEHDDHGNFAGGYYVLYETPTEAANECTVVRMTPERRREKQKERQQQKKQQIKQLQQELQEDNEQPEVKPTSVYRACMKRLAKRHQLTSSDRDAMALAFTDFMAGLTGKLYSINLYNWLEQALRQRMSTELRTAKISAAKDKTAQAHVRREVEKAQYNNNQADQIRSYTPKTTADRMHDDFMDNVNDHVTADTSWADNIELDLDS